MWGSEVTEPTVVEKVGFDPAAVLRPVLSLAETGNFSPHIWAGFVGGSFSFLGVMTLVTGLVGDMLVRIRMNQENILYQLKKSGLDEPK